MYGAYSFVILVANAQYALGAAVSRGGLSSSPPITDSPSLPSAWVVTDGLPQATNPVPVTMTASVDVAATTEAECRLTRPFVPPLPHIPMPFPTGIPHVIVDPVDPVMPTNASGISTAGKETTTYAVTFQDVTTFTFTGVDRTISAVSFECDVLPTPVVEPTRGPDGFLYPVDDVLPVQVTDVPTLIEGSINKLRGPFPTSMDPQTKLATTLVTLTQPNPWPKLTTHMPIPVTTDGWVE